MASFRRIKESLAETAIKISGVASIFVVALIFFFLLKEGIQLFQTERIGDFLFGKNWYPISEPPEFGILPLVLGTILVTFGAAAISIPFGIASAVYISEVAPPRAKEILKSGIELLAAIPSVVLGFIGMITVVPWIKSIFHTPTGL